MNRAHLFALYMLADNFFSIQWKLQAQKRPHNNCYCSVARETLEPGLAGAVHPIRAPGPPPQHLPFRATCLSPRCWRIAAAFFDDCIQGHTTRDANASDGMELATDGR